jgi:MtN3 and saliva related transmembrane protein
LISLESTIGISASIFTAVASIPQLVKIINEKKADDLSAVMLVVLLTGLALWIYYGILKKDWILIFANSFSFLLNFSVLVLSLIFKKKIQNKVS